MSLFTVTVKLPRNRLHDERMKEWGDCPITGKTCSDTTGAHHTVLVEADNDFDAEVWIKRLWLNSPLRLQDRFGDCHVTRIEEVEAL